MKTKLRLPILKKSILIFFFEIAIVQFVFAQDTLNLNGLTLLKTSGKYLDLSMDSLEIDTNHVFVYYKSDVTANSITTVQNTLGLTKKNIFEQSYFAYTLNAAIDFKTNIENLTTDNHVKKVIFTHYIPYLTLPLPNDPCTPSFENYPPNAYYSWYINRLKLNDAWEVSTGDPGIKIAILDDGCFYSADFNLDYNNSYNMVTGTNDITPSNSWSHGTEMVSIISSKTNNQLGMFGIAGGWNGVGGCTSIMFKLGPVSAWEVEIPDALYMAISKGAKVINLSLGSASWYSEPIDEAIEYAYNNGAVLFSGTGNFNNTDIFWPAKHRHVIAVGGVDELDQRWQLTAGSTGSNYGQYTEISTVCGGRDSINHMEFERKVYHQDAADYIDYGDVMTSGATAMASAIAGLILSVNPCLTPEEVRTVLIRSCEKVGGYDYHIIPPDKSIYNGHSDELGYGRVNVKSALDLAQGEPGYNLEGDEYWLGNATFKSAVLVPSGITLTIQDATIKFNTNGEIIVQPGGKLIIKNSTLTRICQDKMWKGVTVQGYYNQNMYSPTQGCVTIENSIIEYADCAIKAPNNVNIAGGIVKAKNCNFTNCKQMYSFSNYTYESSSYFENCNFELNEEAQFEIDNNYRLIDLNCVHGVEFKYCTFKNGLSTTPTGCAIKSYGSSFVLKPGCTSNQINPCPDSFQIPSSIEGFNYGIHITYTYPGIIINKVNFTNNNRGCYVSCAGPFTLIKSIFQIPLVNAGEDAKYGAYFDQCSGYHVEANTFTASAPSVTGNIGLYVSNSGSQPNFVYRNSFSNLSFATKAVGNNRSSDGLAGLCYKCNDFAGNNKDIEVLLPTGGTTSVYSGIALRQGQPVDPLSGIKDTLAACNSFSSAAIYNIYNLSGNNSQYFYQQNNLSGYKINPSPVLNIDKFVNLNTNYDRSLICKSWISNGGSPINQNLITSKNESKTQLSNAGLTLENKVDDGSTQNVTFDIAGSTPDKALELRNELLDVSPYLSDEALKTAIADDNALPNSMLRDVLVENPQTAKSDEMMNMLTDKADPMPDYMIDQVAAGETVLGAREKMEAWYSALRQKDSWLLRQIVDAYLADSVTPDAREQLKTFLAAEHSAEASFILADLYMQDNDYAAAQTIFEDIQGNMEPDEYDNAQCNSYLSLCGILTDMLTDSLPLPDIDSLHAMQLYDLYLSNENIATAKARDLLVAAGWLNYEEPIANASELQSEEIKPDRKPVSTVTKLLVVYPNPASNYIIADYTLPEKIIGAKLIVSNTGGIVLQEIPLTLSRNQVTIPLQNLSSGNYILTLKTDKKVIESVYFSTLK